MFRRRLLTLSLTALLAVTAALAAGCGSGASSGNSVTLVAYSTPREAYDALIAGFERTTGGRGVKFSESFGASGDQSRAVDGGLHADVVAFSLEPDITRLVKDGIVSPSWNANAHRGIVTNSVVALVVRRGNPKHIRGWSDLVRPGVHVVTPNPVSSGSARWNIMAAYGSQIEQGRGPAEAQAYLATLLSHVVVQDKSGRDALQTFAGGKGDVLISYENEAIGARRKGIAVDYVIPPQTILIENPVAVTKDASKPARAFVDFLYTPQAQRIFAAQGYRPVVAGTAAAARFPTPPGLFTIAKLGGWKSVTARFFDPQNGIVTELEHKLGVSAGSR